MINVERYSEYQLPHNQRDMKARCISFTHMNTNLDGTSKYTLQPDVHGVCSVRGARRRLWRALQLGKVHAPLRTERHVHLVLLYNCESRFCHSRKVGIHSGFGSPGDCWEYRDMISARARICEKIFFVGHNCTRLLERALAELLDEIMLDVFLPYVDIGADKPAHEWVLIVPRRFILRERAVDGVGYPCL